MFPLNNTDPLLQKMGVGGDICYHLFLRGPICFLKHLRLQGGTPEICLYLIMSCGFSYLIGVRAGQRQVQTNLVWNIRRVHLQKTYLCFYFIHFYFHSIFSIFTFFVHSSEYTLKPVLVIFIWRIVFGFRRWTLLKQSAVILACSSKSNLTMQQKLFLAHCLSPPTNGLCPLPR